MASRYTVFSDFLLLFLFLSLTTFYYPKTNLASRLKFGFQATLIWTFPVEMNSFIISSSTVLFHQFNSNHWLLNAEFMKNLSPSLWPFFFLKGLEQKDEQYYCSVFCYNLLTLSFNTLNKKTLSILMKEYLVTSSYFKNIYM